MTTTRVPRPAGATTASAPPPSDGDVRLALIDPAAARTTLDGAWWPRSLDLAAELPPLVTELHRRGIVVRRVAYSPGSWEPATRRLRADDRTIRLGWFRTLDPQLLNLSGDDHRARVDLLVVPPESSAEDADRAFAAATDRANCGAPATVLSELRSTGDTPAAG